MRFIGSKDSLIEFIWHTILDLGIKGEVFFDIFSGTTRVTQHFKKKGYTIISPLPVGVTSQAELMDTFERNLGLM